MLDFKPICIDDRARVGTLLYDRGYNSCESSFADLYIWADAYNTNICIEDGTLYIRAGDGEDTYFLFPVGGDLVSALGNIREYAESLGIAPTLRGVTARMCDEMREALPDMFEFTPARSFFDYIYSARALESLAGKKLHQKRNHFNKFMTQYGERYVYEDITRDNIADAFAFQKRWLAAADMGERRDALITEMGAVTRAFDGFFELGLTGGLVRVDGDVVAYCIGSRISADMFCVSIEKGDYAYDGVYQVINRLFVERNCKDVELVNREDDAGVDGLRKAKLSYYPEFLLKKYSVIWRT